MKNEYEVRGNLTVIFINSPKYGPMETVISTSTLERAKEFKNKWYVAYDKRRNTFYVVGNITTSVNCRKIIGLHQWLLGIPIGMMVDHIDHNTLNNAESNLRIVTNAQNSQNRNGAQMNSKSKVRGVYWHKKSSKWAAQIRINGRKISLGVYDDISDAEKVVTEARKSYMPFSADVS